jgi:hypothetical protein
VSISVRFASSILKSLCPRHRRRLVRGDGGRASAQHCLRFERTPGLVCDPAERHARLLDKPAGNRDQHGDRHQGELVRSSIAHLAIELPSDRRRRQPNRQDQLAGMQHGFDVRSRLWKQVEVAQLDAPRLSVEA